MSYTYKLRGKWVCTKPGIYPWPCKPHPDRTVEVFEDDVFTRGADGWTMHTGLMKLGVQIPDENMEFVDGDVNLRVGGM